MPASIDDVVTVLKNIATALSTEATNYVNVNGLQDFYNVTTPTLVRSGAGRIVNISLIVASSANGTVYDAASTSDTTRPIYIIGHSTLGVTVVNLPVQYGVMIVPGTGQTIAGSYS